MNDLSKELQKLGYSFKKIEDSIFMVYDFLTDNQVEKLYSYILSASDKDWETHYMEGVVGLAERKYGRTDIENLVEEGLVEITHHWKDKNLGMPYELSEPLAIKIKEIFSFDKTLKFDGVGTIQRQYSESPLPAHVDNHADPTIEYAVVMYINDDYNGGELYFSNLDIELKPLAKSLMIFPSHEVYKHGVKSPSDGPIRYVMPSFVRKNDA